MRAALLRSHPASLSLGLLLSELRPPCHCHRPPLPLAEQCAQLCRIALASDGTSPTSGLDPATWSCPALSQAPMGSPGLHGCLN